MRALVVGGAGFVGSHLVDRLLAEGHAVDVVDDLSSGSLANLAEARRLSAELTIHTLDAGADEFVALVALRAPDVLYHLGWLPPGHPAEVVAGGALRASMNVLEAARRHGGIKVVTMVAASALYGDVPAREQPLKESQPWRPVGVRGLVTRAVLDLHAAYRDRYAVEYTALAATSVYGPRQRPDGGVVAALLHAADRGDPPVVHGDGRQTRDFLFVDDAVDALVRAARKGGGLVVNTGSGVATSIAELWTAIAGNDAPPPDTSPRDPDDVQRLSLAVTRARIQLGWAPWTDLASGLRALRR